MSSKKTRLRKLEAILGLQEERTFVIDPFGDPDKEVVVYARPGIPQHRISLKEFSKIDTSKDEVLELKVNFV